MSPPNQLEQLTIPLTRREKEVLLLVAQGHSNKAIAEMLCLSAKTVRNHVTHILYKLHVKRRTQLICYAWHMGWVGKDEGREES